MNTVCFLKSTPCSAKGLGVLLFEDEAHFFGQIVAERGDHFAVPLVHDRCARGLVIDPSAVVDGATADGDGFASNRLNLDLEEGRWVWEAFRVGGNGPCGWSAWGRR